VKAKMEEMDEEADSNTTGITEINKSTELERLACSLSRSLKTNPRSPSSTTPAYLPSPVALDEVEELSSEVVANEVFNLNGAAEEVSKG